MATNDFNYLRYHAVNNVWSNPGQDYQYRLQPVRVTPSAGVMRSHRIMWHTVPMPDMYSRWHVFQVGGIDPIAFNLLFRSFEWISLAQASNDRKIMVNIYNVQGVEVPRHECYYRYTQTGAMIFAVRINSRIPVQWATDTFFFRLYSNSFWNSPRSMGITPELKVKGVLVENNAARDLFIAEYNTLKATETVPGTLSFYLNGIKRNNLVPGAITVGDSLEYVWDASVIKQIRLPIKDLHSFESTLDAKRKLLIHFQGELEPQDMIFFHDDLEIHVSGVGTNPHYLYYHHNALDAVRQLTHRDYSLTAAYVERYASRLQQLGPHTATDNMFITLTLRHSGYQRPLTYEHNRINELYKLKDADIINAMVNIDATVPVWRAAALESSGYTALMHTAPCDMTPQLTERAYGYYAMAKYLADTPNEVLDQATKPYSLVPYKLRDGCTAYEYDENGYMLGWHHHYVGDRYYTRNDNTKTVEFISGFGSTVLDEVHGVTNYEIRDDRNYKVYTRTKVAGVLQQNPTDVTASNLYKFENGRFVWTSPSVTAYPTLRSDRNFYAADHSVMATDGLIIINLETQQTYEGVTANHRLNIPLGQLDVWLNGKSLITGLEAFYRNGSVYITAKKWLINPAIQAQTVHIRFSGFCQSNMQLYPEGDTGYVVHGVLSNNNRFDLRDGKVQRIVMNGALVTKDQLIFSEDSDQVSVTDVGNGMPYMIKDLHVPLRSHVAKDTYDLIATARQIDKQVSDYLTLKLPQPDRGPIAAVIDRYMVFSPFFCKLIFDIRNARLALPAQPSYSLQEVVEICKPYEYLLEVDPITRRDVVNTDYVVIHPHSYPTAINLQHHQYQFVNQAVSYYAAGLVTLSPSVTLTK